MKTKVASIGSVAAFVFALAFAQPCAAMGGLGAGVGAMGGSFSFVRASPWANDVPGEPQGQNNFWRQEAAKRAALAKTELHFDLSQCQQIETGLYNCSATDKPICNADYKGQAECVGVGPNGGVFVQSRSAK